MITFKLIVYILRLVLFVIVFHYSVFLRIPRSIVYSFLNTSFFPPIIVPQGSTAEQIENFLTNSVNY